MAVKPDGDYGTTGGIDNTSVVELDAIKALKLWRLSELRQHDNMLKADPATWSHTKFCKIEEWLFEGAISPYGLAVALPEAYISKKILRRKRCFWFDEDLAGPPPEISAMDFDDGVTRTMWLLKHQSPYFPVKCRSKNASQLFSIAGLAGGGFSKVSDLLS